MPRFWVGGLADNLRTMQRDAAEAAQANCEIVVFPEQFLSGYYGENDPSRIKACFGAVSSEHPSRLFIFGTMSDEGYNRLYVYRGGQPLGYYDKIHLFKPNGEDQMWKVGDRYIAVEHAGWAIGLATCNDLRFAEQAQKLKAELGVKLLVYPALWPWQRDHIWKSLLQARAIENGVFCAGCSVAGVDNGKERFDGAGNYLFGPLGDPVFPQDRVYELDLAMLDQVNVDTRKEFVNITKVELLGAKNKS